MPVGPVEIASSWFALARLAYSTTSFRFWSKATDARAAVNLNVTVMSRVMEYLSKLSASVGDPADAQRYKTVEHKHKARLKTKQLVSERSKARSSFLRLKRAA